MELVKTPVPVPSVVLLSAVVGFWLMLQHTPRAVTDVPPSKVILPPVLAEVEVTADTLMVVKTGATDSVLKETWLPYPVPATLVA
jgi:hypothetical protein